MYERFWGEALQLFRVWHQLSQEETLMELNRRSGRRISIAQFDDMEKGALDIDEGLFNIWCDLFPGGRIRALKYAQFFYEHAEYSEQDVIEEGLREIEYQLWRRQQERQ